MKDTKEFKPNKVEVARKMLSDAVPLRLIALTTGLPHKLIARLKPLPLTQWLNVEES